MPRYCKQYTKTDCGPTAVLNALKWAGYKLTLKKGYTKLRKKCLWSKGSGTDAKDLLKVINQYSKIKASKKFNYSLNTLDKILSNNKSFILLYTYTVNNKDYGHFIFGFGQDERHFKVYNDDVHDKPNKRITRKLMNKYLRRRTRDHRPWVPIIIEVSKR